MDEMMTLFNVIANSGMEIPILLGDFNHGPAGTGGLRYVICFTRTLIIYHLNAYYSSILTNVLSFNEITKPQTLSVKHLLLCS